MHANSHTPRSHRPVGGRIFTIVAVVDPAKLAWQFKFGGAVVAMGFLLFAIFGTTLVERVIAWVYGIDFDERAGKDDKKS